MAGHLQVLLEGVVANPDAPIGQLPLLRSEERRQLVVDWNGTAADYPRDQTIHALFKRRRRRRRTG